MWCILMEKNIMHIHYKDFCTGPSIRHPVPIQLKFTILEDPSLVIISLYLICLIHSVNKKRRRNIACSLYDQALAQESLPWGVMTFTILVKHSSDVINLGTDSLAELFGLWLMVELFGSQLMAELFGSRLMAEMFWSRPMAEMFGSDELCQLVLLVWHLK